MQIFRFPSFRLCPFYPTGINIGSKRPQHVLKHVEKQAETRRVQSFGAKFGASAADANTLLTLTWPMCQIWHILFLQILNAPADCMVKQTL